MVDDGVGLEGSIRAPSAEARGAKPESATGTIPDKSLEEIDDIIGRIIGREEAERLAAQHQTGDSLRAQEYGLVGWPGETDTVVPSSFEGASGGSQPNTDGNYMNISYYSAHSEVDDSGHSEQIEFFDVPSPALNAPTSDAVVDSTTDVPAVVISPPPSGDDLLGLQTDRRHNDSVSGLAMPAMELPSLVNGDAARRSSFQGTRSEIDDQKLAKPPSGQRNTPASPPVASTAAAGSLWHVTLQRSGFPSQQTDGHHVGVGIGVEVDKVTGQIVIDQVYPGSSAEKNGQIEWGDIILQVNGASATGMAALEVQHLLMGETGTVVNLLLHRSKHGPSPKRSSSAKTVPAAPEQRAPMVQAAAQQSEEELAIAEALAEMRRAQAAREQMEAEQDAEERRVARQLVLEKRRQSKLQTDHALPAAPPPPAAAPPAPAAAYPPLPQGTYVALRPGAAGAATTGSALEAAVYPPPADTALHPPGAQYRKTLPPTPAAVPGSGAEGTGTAKTSRSSSISVNSEFLAEVEAATEEGEGDGLSLAQLKQNFQARMNEAIQQQRDRMRALLNDVDSKILSLKSPDSTPPPPQAPPALAPAASLPLPPSAQHPEAASFSSSARELLPPALSAPEPFVDWHAAQHRHSAPHPAHPAPPSAAPPQVADSSLAGSSAVLAAAAADAEALKPAALPASPHSKPAPPTGAPLAAIPPALRTELTGPPPSVLSPGAEQRQRQDARAVTLMTEMTALREQLKAAVSSEPQAPPEAQKKLAMDPAPATRAAPPLMSAEPLPPSAATRPVQPQASPARPPQPETWAEPQGQADAAGAALPGLAEGGAAASDNNPIAAWISNWVSSAAAVGGEESADAVLLGPMDPMAAIVGDGEVDEVVLPPNASAELPEPILSPKASPALAQPAPALAGSGDGGGARAAELELAQASHDKYNRLVEQLRQETSKTPATLLLAPLPPAGTALQMDAPPHAPAVRQMDSLAGQAPPAHEADEIASVSDEGSADDSMIQRHVADDDEEEEVPLLTRKWDRSVVSRGGCMRRPKDWTPRQPRPGDSPEPQAKPRAEKRSILGAALAATKEVLSGGHKSIYSPAHVMTPVGPMVVGPEGPVPPQKHPFVQEQILTLQVLRANPELASKPAEVVKAVSLAVELGTGPALAPHPHSPPRVHSSAGRAASSETAPSAPRPKIQFDATVATEDGDSAKRLHEKSMSKRKQQKKMAEAMTAHNQEMMLQMQHQMQQGLMPGMMQPGMMPQGGMPGMVRPPSGGVPQQLGPHPEFPGYQVHTPHSPERVPMNPAQLPPQRPGQDPQQLALMAMDQQQQQQQQQGRLPPQLQHQQLLRTQQLQMQQAQAQAQPSLYGSGRPTEAVVPGRMPSSLPGKGPSHAAVDNPLQQHPQPWPANPNAPHPPHPEHRPPSAGHQAGGGPGQGMAGRAVSGGGGVRGGQPSPHMGPQLAPGQLHPHVMRPGMPSQQHPRHPLAQAPHPNQRPFPASMPVKGMMGVPPGLRPPSGGMDENARR